MAIVYCGTSWAVLMKFIPVMPAIITLSPWRYNARKLDGKVEKDNSYIRTDDRSVEPYKEHIILIDWGLTFPSCSYTAMLLVIASKVATLTFHFSFGSSKAFSNHLLLKLLAYPPLHCDNSMRNHQKYQKTVK